MKCDDRVKVNNSNPYLTFLAGLPEEAGEDAEDGLDLLFGLRSWLGWAGSLIGRNNKEISELPTIQLISPYKIS